MKSIINNSQRPRLKWKQEIAFVPRIYQSEIDQISLDFQLINIHFDKLSRTFKRIALIIDRMFNPGSIVAKI